MPSHKITILIPTKDRKEFLFYTLKSCLNQDYQNFEVIVLDDSSSDGSIQMIENLMQSNSKLRLIKNTKNVGMMDNFENALDNVDSGYVLFLGGDDGLMPNALKDLNSIIQETEAKLITWPHSTFFYPGTKMKTGQLIINRKSLSSKKEFKWIKGEHYLNSQAKKLFYVSDDESPMIYVKGIASMNVIKEIKLKSPNNKFYQCSTPDGYSGFVLAGHLDQYLYCRKPFTIHGVCNSSQGLNYVKKGDKSKKISESFFDKMKDFKMHKNLGSIPYSPLITLMTADFIYTSNEINFKKIRITPKKIIENSLSELQDGLYGEEKISRELNIISLYSKHVNEYNFFLKQLKSKRRNKRYVYEGDGISPNLLYLNSSKLNVTIIYEASYYIKYFIQSYNVYNLKVIFKTLVSSINYKLSSFKKTKNLYSYYVGNN